MYNVTEVVVTFAVYMKILAKVPVRIYVPSTITVTKGDIVLVTCMGYEKSYPFMQGFHCMVHHVRTRKLKQAILPYAALLVYRIDKNRITVGRDRLHYEHSSIQSTPIHGEKLHTVEARTRGRARFAKLRRGTSIVRHL